MPRESLATPEAVVAALSRALAARRWRDAVAFLDEASLQEFHRSQTKFIPERVAPPRTLTADDLMRHEPEMPRDVAEYTVRQHRRHQEDHIMHPEHEFAGITSWAEIATLAPDDLASRWLEAHDPANEMRRQLARKGRPSLADDFLPPQRQLLPLGHVREGDNLAHVVCRERYAQPGFAASGAESPGSESDPAPGWLQIVPVRRDERGDWYVLFDYVLLTGRSVALVYDEPSDGKSAAGTHPEPNTAA